MKTKAKDTTLEMEPPAGLRDAAARAHDALGVGHQMQAMLREYTQLEAEHAARLRALAQRMGDCVDHMRPTNQANDLEEGKHEEEEEEVRARQSQCVAVMDEVVTFLTRFASMHRHLSECLASDLFGEWSDALTVQQKRMDAQEPELRAAQHELKECEGVYREAHADFQSAFERACVLYVDAVDVEGTASEKEAIEQQLQDELASLAANGVVATQRRTRSPSKAMQYVGSISKMLRSSTTGIASNQRRQSSAAADSGPSVEPLRGVADAMLSAEHERQQCQRAYQSMHRLHVRYKRLCDSLHQEYRCVHSECLASTRTSIRKLVIHVSAFTSNLQYDATQLFQQVEALHANYLDGPHSHSTPLFAPVVPSAASSSSVVPPPPLDVPLTVQHVVRRRFPAASERPRLLRHQNACHLLSFSGPSTILHTPRDMAATSLDSSAPLSDLQQRIQDRKRTHLELVNRKLEREKRAKSTKGAERSLYILTRENPLRRLCLRIATSRLFDGLIIVAIIVNSVIIGLSDFDVVDKQLNPASEGMQYLNGQLVPAFSMRNYIVELSEMPSTVLFACEAVIKIIAFGFMNGHGTYLRDSWNQLDFFVVLSSLVGVLPGIPNVSAIRTIRVLRPLRSLSMIPGMRRLISALLKALPALANVLILQLFVFAIFGILGIQLFGGNMNRRCRLTEHAVKLPPGVNGTTPQWPVPDEYLNQALADPKAFQCIPDTPMLDDGDPQSGLFTKESSPWRTPQDCFWPIDQTDKLLCVVPGVSGNHVCAKGQTCGSDYDTYGNQRFSLSKVMDAALFTVDMNWGFTNFDNIGRAFFTIFQSITMEGWTGIMYMVMDGGSPIVGALFFVILIIFASFFVMNLTLAVISDEFNIDDDDVSTPTAAEQKALALVLDAKHKLQTQRDKPRFPILFQIVSHPVFSTIIMLVILANTAVLALDHHPMPAKLDADLEMINFGLSCVFLLEMLMKLFGLGFRLYARDKFNLFDAFVVTMGVLETVASPPSFLTDDTQPRKGAVSALRSFRLFRVFKLARDWGSFRGLLELIVRAVASIGNFAVLLFLFIYIYALVGLQFFANTMRYDGDGYLIPGNGVSFWEGNLPRNNFDSLLWSVVTVFQVITGENWNNIMYDTMRGNGMGSCVYFISLVVFGNFILMNLFLALLLDNFDNVGNEDDEARKADEMKMLAMRMSTMKVLPAKGNNGSTRVLPLQSVTVEKSPHHQQQPMVTEAPVDAAAEDEPVNAIDLDHLNEELARELDTPLARQKERKMGASKAPPPLRASQLEKNRIEPIPTTPPPPPSTPLVDKTFQLMPPSGKLFFLIDETNPLRQYAYRLIIHPWFDSLILVLIVISSISLALDNPLERPDSRLKLALAEMDTVFASVFMVEMVAKILALGVIADKEAYLRKGWNILDGLIVVSSIVMLVAESSPTLNSKQFKSLRSLRGLRTFRPLRMISRRPGLRLVVNSLFEAIPKVMNVLFLCLLFYFIFSIISVNYLKGLFYACQGDVFNALSSDQQSFLTQPVSPWSALTSDQQNWFTNTTCNGFASPSDKITSRYVCGCWGATWGRVLPEHFDNVGSAMLTYFEISTTEGWADVMMAAIDATDIDMQPIRDHTEAWAYFFVLFIMVGSFFVVNLFVGVIIENFNKMKELLGEDFMLSDEQKKWIEARKTASRVVPKRRMTRPKHRMRGVAYDLVKMPRFEWFIILCIIVNTVLMGVQYFGQPTQMVDTIGLINEVFAVIFTLEAVLKIIAFGRAYFDDTWNNFDFFVVLGTLFSILIEAMTGASVRSLAMLVRVFRVTRIIRLIKASKSIRQILLTLYIALPGLSNITSILFLMLFIYATMGVQFFAKVKFTSNINTHANFQDFWTAFLFLLRAATGEAWNSCMHDLANTQDCVDDPPYDETMCGFSDADDCVPINGCGSPVAFLYFCSFTLLVTYVMLNLTIAVILEGFSQSQSENDDDEEPLFEPEMLDEFQQKWAEIDFDATGFLHVRKIRLLITLLEEPLGRKDVLTDKNAFMIYMRGLRLPVYEGDTVYFQDVLLAMAREMVKENVAEDPDSLSDLPMPGDVPSRLCMDYEAHEYYAVRAIEKRVRQWLDEKREHEHKAMDEYKSKIKKPSGRPKKVRDARVYTIG